jgi:hypothetical protein
MISLQVHRLMMWLTVGLFKDPLVIKHLTKYIILLHIRNVEVKKAGFRVSKFALRQREKKTF